MDRENTRRSLKDWFSLRGPTSGTEARGQHPPRFCQTVNVCCCCVLTFCYSSLRRNLAEGAAMDMALKLNVVAVLAAFALVSAVLFGAF